MKAKVLFALFVLACLAGMQQATAQGTAFTYQGKLNTNGSPANGSFDFEFKLFPDPLGSQPQVGATFLTNGIPVASGLFTAAMDFGSGIFTGSNYWLLVGVRTNGGSTFTNLSPLQPVTPTPYAIMANGASNLLGVLPTSKLNGTVGNGQLANSSITVSAGTGLSGGGTVALGGATSLTNAGVLSVTGNSDITANTTAGAVTLGDTGTSASSPNTLVKRDATGSFSATNLTLGGTLGLPAISPGNPNVIYGNNENAGGLLLLYGDGKQNFFGGGAGASGVNGSDNTGFGSGALDNDYFASDNTAYGAGALFNILSGSGSSAFGDDALLNLKFGSNNIAVGINAGAAFTLNETGNIDIGNVGMLGDNNVIRIGSNQVQAFIAGTIMGNGGGLTNLSAAQLSGAIPGGVTLPATNLTGTIPLAQLPAVAVTNGESGVTIGGTNVVAALTVLPNVPVGAVGSLELGSGASPISVALAGRYAYVANFSSNTLQIIDVSIPSNPVSISVTPTAGSSPSSVVVAGRYAYVVNRIVGTGTLQIFDVSNPFSPVSVGSVGTGILTVSVAVAGRYAYVLNGNISGALQIFDVSNPASPVKLSSFTPGNQPISLAVAGRYAYVGASAGLQIIDVSNPANPVSASSVVIGAPSSIAVSGAYAYMVFGTDTLGIYDISNPALPVNVGSAGTGTGPTTVAVAGRYAYVLNYTIFNGNPTTLQIFDVSTPSNPVSIGTVNTSFNPSSLTVSGRYAYVLTQSGNNLQVFDLGGAYIQQLEAGTIETGTLQTRDTATVGNDLNVRGGLTVSGSARVSGGLSVDNGNISGDGGGLTNLNATKLSGVLPALSGASLMNLTAGNLTGALPAISGTSLTSLPANAALLNSNQTFTATNTFNKPVGIATTTTPQALLEIQGGADNTGANDQKDISLAYRTGGYRHWIRTRHNSSTVDNAIDFFVNTNNAAGGSSAPGVGNVLAMSINGGNVGIATAEPQATLDVNGSLRVNSGTTFTNFQAGQTAMSGGSATFTNSLSISFPKAFITTPKVIATANGQAGTAFGDTFVVSVRSATTTGCVVNIVRVDANTGWSQTISINWMAWE